MDAWLREMSDYLVDKWGIAAQAAVSFATLWLYLYWYGLNPQITSGRRSAEYQKQLRDRWDRGDRAGLAVRPALVSTHTQGIGIDISTSDPALAARIAQYLNIRAGYNFRTPDPVHFDLV